MRAVGTRNLRAGPPGWVVGSSWAGVADIPGVALASGNSASLSGHETFEETFSCLSVETVLRQVFRHGISRVLLPSVHLLSKVVQSFLMIRVGDDVVELVVVTAEVEQRFGGTRRTKDIGLGQCEFTFVPQTKQVPV